MRLLAASELSARISHALQRVRSMHHSSAARLMLGDVEIDLDQRLVISRGQSMRLTPKEFNLLGFMIVHANQVLSSREILQAVWGPEYGSEHARLHVIVNQLRKKIEARPSQPVYLFTVPRVGYRLHVPPPTNPDVPLGTSQ